MPLPKLPTRPAAILDLEDLALEEGPSEAERNLPQTSFEGFEPAPLAFAEKAVVAKKGSLPPVARKPGMTPSARSSKSAQPVQRADKPSEQKPSRLDASSGKALAGEAATRRNNKKSSPKMGAGAQKLFVLDTNVLMHDPSSLFRFEEHDVFLPMMTLEELDNHKKGMSEVARNARQVSRSLDALIQDQRLLDQGLPLSTLGHKDATGKLFVQTTAIASSLPSDLPMGKADNQILGGFAFASGKASHSRGRSGVQGHQYAHQGT